MSDENHSENHTASRDKVGIGIDFGTSNSVSAVYDGHTITLVQLEKTEAIMPSASYINRDFVTTTGQDAIEDYIHDNQGRRVELSAEVLGEARSGTDGLEGMSNNQNMPSEFDTDLVYGQSFVDGSLPGRLFRGTKRLLGDAEIKRIMVFDRPFRLVALITPILVRMRKAITQTLISLEKPTELASRACIGHPVNFEGHDPQHNTLALERLSESYRHAGVIDQTFYPEPTAATLSYLHAHPHQKSDVILTVDFGGGTLDLCILERKDGEFAVRAIHGIGLGGDHIDQALFRELIFPMLGKGERWIREIDGKTVDTLFPFDIYEGLLINWTVSYMLNQNQYTTPVLSKIRQNGSDAEKFQRLYELITQNYSYQVFQAIKDCKARLSSVEETILDIPEVDIETMITRTDFEIIISDLLQRFEKAVLDTLNKASVNPADIQLVVRTGGSSLIPAVKDTLEHYFPGRVIEHDAFTSVAAGLAIADYEGKSISEEQFNH